MESVSQCFSRGRRAVKRFLQGPPPSDILFCILLFFCLVLLYAVLLMSPLECGRGSWLCYLLGVERKESVVRGLGIAVAGTLSIWAVWIANHRAEEMKQQTDVAQRTVRATEERLVQERFRDAVGHLGHDSESVRLNGAYALFRLAVQEASYRAWVAQTLCLHIIAVTGDGKYRETYAKVPSGEIQALMRLLFERGSELEGLRSEAEREAFWKEFPIDLSGGYFRGLALKNARFRGANLADTQFQGANLEGAQFQGAGLAGARFQGAYLADARFQGERLAGAGFQGAHLWLAQFQGAYLTGAQFQGANLEGAGFQGANLAGTQFQEASLVSAQFQGVAAIGSPSASFERRIKSRIGRADDVSRTVFAGGLEREEAKRITETLKELLREEEIQRFERDLAKHVGREASHALPDEAQGGTYDEAQARAWIEEYKKEMGE